MADQTITIADDTLDGSEDGGTWSDRVGSYAGHHYFFIGEKGGTEKIGGLRFTGINIDQGTQITTATITFGVHFGAQAKAITLDVYGDDVDDAPAWGAASRPSSGFTRTTNSGSVALSSTERETGDTIQITITDVVQEILDRVGWVSGNAIRVLVERNSSSATYNEMQVDDYESDDTTGVASLYIEWPDAGGNPVHIIQQHARRRR